MVPHSSPRFYSLYDKTISFFCQNATIKIQFRDKFLVFSTNGRIFMAYTKQDLEEKILTLSEKYVTLDNLEERAMAQKDPALFLQLPFRVLSGYLDNCLP